MKKFINSWAMKWFRKLFVEAIYFQILHNKNYYCCHVKTWHSWFICWKNLKEVKENMNSIYLIKDLPYICSYDWFMSKERRLGFLNECIKKF